MTSLSNAHSDNHRQGMGIPRFSSGAAFLNFKTNGGQQFTNWQSAGSYNASVTQIQTGYGLDNFAIRGYNASNGAPYGSTLNSVTVPQSANLSLQHARGTGISSEECKLSNPTGGEQLGQPRHVPFDYTSGIQPGSYCVDKNTSLPEVLGGKVEPQVRNLYTKRCSKDSDCNSQLNMFCREENLPENITARNGISTKRPAIYNTFGGEAYNVGYCTPIGIQETPAGPKSFWNTFFDLTTPPQSLPEMKSYANKARAEADSEAGQITTRVGNKWYNLYQGQRPPPILQRTAEGKGSLSATPIAYGSSAISKAIAFPAQKGSGSLGSTSMGSGDGDL